MKESLLLNALYSRNTKRAPVWLMRQAGRYMPQYRALREKYTFLEMCHTPELVAEVTLQPIKAFGMDAAILFSDILVIPEALNLGLRFDDGIGPIFERPLSSPSDLLKLPDIEIREALRYVGEGIALVKPQLAVPLIGFCGAPFTVASYMIEGRSSRDLRKTKLWMLRDPESFHQLLTKLTDHSIQYLQMQVDQGVEAIQVFDSWANVLSHSHFVEFSLTYIKKIVAHFKGQVPVIVFCRGSSAFAPLLATAEPQAISLDWNCDLSQMRRQIPQSIALQGNLDPDILYAPLPVLKRQVKSILQTMQGERGYVFNLGHGITPQVSPDAVKALVETVQEYSHESS